MKKPTAAAEVKIVVAETEKKARKPPGEGRKFQKGVSGNPNGRPKLTSEELDLIAACKDRTPKALAVLDHIMAKGKSERTRLTAALAVIDRAYGQPRLIGEINQNVNVNHSGTIFHRAVQEINARITELLGTGADGDNETPLPH